MHLCRHDSKLQCVSTHRSFLTQKKLYQRSVVASPTLISKPQFQAEESLLLLPLNISSSSLLLESTTTFHLFASLEFLSLLKFHCLSICRKSSTTTCHSFTSLEVSSPARLLQPVCTQGKQVAPIVPRNSDKTSCCSVLMRSKFFWFWSSYKAPWKQQTILESSSHHQCSSPPHRTRFPQ